MISTLGREGLALMAMVSCRIALTSVFTMFSAARRSSGWAFIGERGESRPDVSPRIAALPTDLYRNELLLRRTPPTHAVIAEIVDDVFLPLVRTAR